MKKLVDEALLPFYCPNISVKLFVGIELCFSLEQPFPTCGTRTTNGKQPVGGTKKPYF
jgi:hypothetical protein